MTPARAIPRDGFTEKRASSGPLFIRAALPRRSHVEIEESQAEAPNAITSPVTTHSSPFHL
jgi:hypothetical protein